MAYFKTKTIHGQRYLYVCETRLVDRKPRPVTLAYLGKPEALLQRLAQSPGAPLRLQSFAHGAVAVLLSLVQRLGVPELFEAHKAPVHRGTPEHGCPSVGWTLALGAVGLAVRPTSKRGFAAWAQTTTLPRLAGFRAAALTSQYFWDQMDHLPSAALGQAGAELSRRVAAWAAVKLDRLFYDSSNFYTFIASDNAHCDLPQRGHSKQKRHDLRQLNLGLLVARDGWIPLQAHLYRGNLNDVSHFPEALALTRQQLLALGAPLEDVTLVCDKGHWSVANWAALDRHQLHYVTSVPAGRAGATARRPVAEFEAVQHAELGEVRALRCTQELAGRSRTMVVLDSPTLRQAQLRGLQQRLQKPVAALCRLKQRLRTGRRRPRLQVEQQLARLLASPTLKKLVAWELRETADRRWDLDWGIDPEAYAELRDTVYGRRVLVTDRSAWTTAEILEAYWGQSTAEHLFAALKDPQHCALHTPHHWTDQKLEVHALLTLLACTLQALIRRTARRLGYTQDTAALVDLLNSIRAVRVCEVRDHPGRPRVRWQMETVAPEALRLYRELVLPQYDLGSIHKDA